MNSEKSIWYYKKKVIEQYGDTDFVKKNIENKKVKIENSKFVIPRIEVVVTLRCNLRCMGCSHLMDRYSNPYDLDMNEILRYLKQLFTCIDECICVGITGGEPFLYPNLSTIVEYLCKNQKISFIEINTNGTIIPQSVSYLKNSKVSIYISRYPDIKKPQKLIDKLENNHVFYYYEDETPWIDYGSFQSRNYRKSQLTQNFIECMDASFCKTLLGGRLYCCPREAFSSDLGIFVSDDCIDLNDILTPEDLLTKLNTFYGMKYSKICNYCSFNLSGVVSIKPGIQAK